jgi:MscS family membrane protein
MRISRIVAVVACGWVLLGEPIAAQGPPAAPPAAPAPQPAASRDSLGRDTPRGTVIGFLEAGRRGDDALARQYLDTPLSGAAAEQLARQLFVVLDARLPPRLTQISDHPEGSPTDVRQLDRELVGTISAKSGPVELYVERQTRRRTTAIWLFSEDTLSAVPSLYDEVAASRRETALPAFLTSTRAGGLRVLDWIVVMIGLPLFFVATAMLDRLLLPVVRPLWRLGGLDATVLHTVLPVPARLLLLAIAGRWLIAWLPLSLLVRQFWSAAVAVIIVVAVVWLLILLNGEIEGLIRRRLPQTGVSAPVALLRFLRRIADGLVLLGGFVALLWRVDINPTPALAGLGVGGLAVALAAQKTLENVVAGASLIFDQAVRVGDYLRMDTIEGTVDHVGLRSTRIRTLDRSVVSVPNGQLANVSLETLSARDKYWFHPEIRLRYDTRAQQLRAVLEGIRRLLAGHASIDAPSVRVRFFRLGPSSFDIEVFAYVFARDWNHYLEIQEGLLFEVAGAIERAGAHFALPSQTVYLTGSDTPSAAMASLSRG